MAYLYSSNQYFNALQLKFIYLHRIGTHNKVRNFNGRVKLHLVQLQAKPYVKNELLCNLPYNRLVFSDMYSLIYAKALAEY